MTLQRAAVLVLLLTSCGPMGKPSENAPTVATVDPARITIPLPRRGNISYCSTCFTNDQEPARVAPLRRYWSPDASRLLLISDAAHCRLALLAVQPGRANRGADLPHEVSDDRSESAFRAAVESVAAAIGGEVQSVAQLEHVPEDARLAPDGSSVLLYSGMFCAFPFDGTGVPLLEFRDTQGRILASVPGGLERGILICQVSPPTGSRRSMLLWVDELGRAVVADKLKYDNLGPAEDFEVKGWRSTSEGKVIAMEPDEIRESARSVMNRPGDLHYAELILLSEQDLPR